MSVAAKDMSDAGAAGALDAPLVQTPIPGPRSTQYLARQAAHESNARSYPRNLPIAHHARRGLLRRGSGRQRLHRLPDAGAGVLALGHSHPEVVEAVAAAGCRCSSTALDFPTEPKDEFTSTQLSLLPEAMRDRTKIQFCGPTGANAVDAALKLCKTATGRADIIAFHGAFHGSSHSAMAVTGLVSQKEPRRRTRCPASISSRTRAARHCALGGDPDTAGERCLEYFERALTRPARRYCRCRRR